MREYQSLIPDDNIPKNIIVSEIPDEKEIYEGWLSKRKNSNVKIIRPKSEKDVEILTMAKKNAVNNIEQQKLITLSDIQNDYNEVVAYIKEKLNLKKFPHIVECYDISHIQGTNTVASGVVFENGMPKKAYIENIN